jgi:hypothetical protein
VFRQPGEPELLHQTFRLLGSTGWKFVSAEGPSLAPRVGGEIVADRSPQKADVAPGRVVCKMSILRTIYTA